MTIGTDVTALASLKANEGLSCNGMMLAGKGFKIDRKTAERFIAEDGEESRQVIRPYLGGSELMQQRKDRFVIDFFGVTEAEARQRFPRAYEHLLEKVKPERDKNSDKGLREKMGLFGRVRPEIREANEGLSRYIATTETTKHGFSVPAD